MTDRNVKCPICGDPGPFKLWLDERPPVACAYDEAAYAGLPAAVKTVTDCTYQMNKAEQGSRWRKACPEEFDGSGNILPGGVGRILMKMYELGDFTPLII